MKYSKIYWRKIAFYLLLFLVFLVIFMPARALLLFLDEKWQSGILATNGFVWNGSATIQAPVGKQLIITLLDWSFCPQITVPLTICVDIESDFAKVTTNLEVVDSRVILSNAKLQAELTKLATLSDIFFAKQIQAGSLTVNFDRLIIAQKEQGVWPLLWQGKGKISKLHIATLANETIDANFTFSMTQNDQQKTIPTIDATAQLLDTDIKTQALLTPEMMIQTKTNFHVNKGASSEFTNLLQFFANKIDESNYELQHNFKINN